MVFSCSKDPAFNTLTPFPVLHVTVALWPEGIFSYNPYTWIQETCRRAFLEEMRRAVQPCSELLAICPGNEEQEHLPLNQVKAQLMSIRQGDQFKTRVPSHIPPHLFRNFYYPCHLSSAKNSAWILKLTFFKKKNPSHIEVLQVSAWHTELSTQHATLEYRHQRKTLTYACSVPYTKEPRKFFFPWYSHQKT